MKNFSTEHIDDILICKLKIKKATLNESEEFKNLIASYLENDTRKVVIDLYNCEYFDSTFLGTLVASLKKLSAKGVLIRLVGSNSYAQSILDTTGISKVFSCSKTREEAIASFNNAGI